MPNRTYMAALTAQQWDAGAGRRRNSVRRCRRKVGLRRRYSAVEDACGRLGGTGAYGTSAGTDDRTVEYALT